METPDRTESSLEGERPDTLVPPENYIPYNTIPRFDVGLNEPRGLDQTPYPKLTFRTLPQAEACFNLQKKLRVRGHRLTILHKTNGINQYYADEDISDL